MLITIVNRVPHQGPLRVLHCIIVMHCPVRRSTLHNFGSQNYISYIQKLLNFFFIAFLTGLSGFDDQKGDNIT